MSLGKPYKEKIEEGFVVRTFFFNTDPDELKWHWDEQDRLVELLEPTDWLFQFDNHLPVTMEKPIIIPKGTMHRVIKGTGDLKVKITFLNE